MTPTHLKNLKDIIKYLKKTYKPCKEIFALCLSCQVQYAISVLEELVETREWFNKEFKK